MDGRVDVPMNKVVFFKLVGLVYVGMIVLQDELEDGRRTSLDKFDKYFYESILSLLANDYRPYIPFK